MNARKLLFTAIFAAAAWNCREPYRDLPLEIAWGDELSRNHARYASCVRGKHEAYFELRAAEILEHVELNPYEIRFCLTNRTQVNAYALPAGSIYIHAGLVNASPSESALIYVLSHEIAHVLLRHAFRMERTRRTGREFARRIPGRAPATPARLFGTAGLLRFSRRYEQDADLKALDLTARAGYDPGGAVDFLETLRKMEYGRRSLLSQMFSTHPRPARRLRYMKRRLARMHRKQYYREESAGYLALKKFARARANSDAKHPVR